MNRKNPNKPSPVNFSIQPSLGVSLNAMTTPVPLVPNADQPSGRVSRPTARAKRAKLGRRSVSPDGLLFAFAVCAGLGIYLFRIDVMWTELLVFLAGLFLVLLTISLATSSVSGAGHSAASERMRLRPRGAAHRFMLSYIDHVSLAVRDLDGAITQFRDRLSFFVSKKRAEKGSPLENSVMPLAQGYMEIVSISNPKLVPSHAEMRTLNAFLSVREGLFSFAINSSDLANDVRHLRGRGSRLSDPAHEPLEIDGMPAGWWTASVPDDTEGILPFVIQYDQTTEERARRAALSQPYGVVMIDEVTIIVPKLEAAIAAYERDFGVTPNRQLGGRAQLALGGGKINLVPSKMAPLGTPLGLYSVGLGTTDIKGARATLNTRGISFSNSAYSLAVAIRLEPNETFGATIELVQT